MPLLRGILVVSADIPSFVIPVFVHRLGSNQSLIQQIDKEGQVTAFLDIDVGNRYESVQEHLEVTVDSAALWGFRTPDGEVLWGKAAEISENLNRNLERGDYRKLPLIEAQIASFCNSPVYESALLHSFWLIKLHSPLMADIWRDSVILLPLAKSELAKGVPKHLLDGYLNSVRVIGKDGRIEIILPRILFEFYQQEFKPKLNQTEKLGGVFGLSSPELVQSDSGPETFIEPTSLEEVHGELISFTGIGDVVAGNSPSYRRVKLLVPPWIDGQKRPKGRPLLSFCVINTEERNIDASLRIGKRIDRETIKIAIVTWPITFGTSSGHKLDLNALTALHPTFDYTFIVANHVLQKPTGLAPRLAASSRAVKYVRACIDGLMQIVWASTGPKTPRDFFKIFPRGGFGLVGRGGATKDTTPPSALFDAIGSTLNERLPLYRSQRLAVVGSSSILSHPHTEAFIDESVIKSHNNVLSVETNHPRLAVTILGFGIRPVEFNELRLREFCIDLLRSRNFEMLRDSDIYIYGKFPKIGSVAFSFTVPEFSIDKTLSTFGRIKVKRQCILANFTPSRSLARHCASRGVLIFHYAMLDEFLSGKRTIHTIKSATSQ